MRPRCLPITAASMRVIFVITLLSGGRTEARADSSVEVSGATGFGVFVVGVTSPRFAISPSASASLRGEG